MLDLIPKIAPILLVDILNPVLFAMLVVAAGSARPVANSFAMLAGHTLAYFSAGVAVAFGFERVAERLANPHHIDFAISAVLGVALIWMALDVKKDGAPVAKEPEKALTLAGCFGIGAVVNFVAIPFALPYFAVVDQIASADLSLVNSYGVLAVYNIGYATPFVVVPVAVAIYGEQARPLLEKINGYIGRFSDILMPWMFGLLGLVLVADSATYLFTGEGLIQY